MLLLVLLMIIDRSFAERGECGDRRQKKKEPRGDKNHWTGREADEEEEEEDGWLIKYKGDTHTATALNECCAPSGE